MGSRGITCSLFYTLKIFSELLWWECITILIKKYYFIITKKEVLLAASTFMSHSFSGHPTELPPPFQPNLAHIWTSNPLVTVRSLSLNLWAQASFSLPSLSQDRSLSRHWENVFPARLLAGTHGAIYKVFSEKLELDVDFRSLGCVLGRKWVFGLWWV